MFPSKQVNLVTLANDNHPSELVTPDPSNIVVHQDNATEIEGGSRLNFGDLDNLYVDFSSPPYRDMIKSTNDYVFASKSRKMDEKELDVVRFRSETHEENDNILSTNARIRLACEWFIESYSSKVDEISDSSHPFAVSSCGLPDDEAKDIQLLLTLLASAEKTSQRQFDRASKLIEICYAMSSDDGNPVERLVYYFSEAIREKINRETGKVAQYWFESMHVVDLQEALTSVDKCILSFHNRLPLSRVYQFSAINTILDNVGEARKVHVIDLQIRTGIKYMVMLQTLASKERHLEQFKITAVGTRAESKIKDAGKRLAEFAKSINIPFSFKIVMVTDMLDFNIDLLELDDEEKVAVCAPFFLSTLISKPNHLEFLMRVIRKINPCITVVTEVEANHTTPAFANRFTEALFFYGALFDSMSSCLANDNRLRKVSESLFYGQTIRNIVAAEGDERTIRHIGVNVWRSFFSRFGMAEIELSDELVFEAKLSISSFDCGKSCTIRVDGGCLLIDWKDVPVFSVSAWKFA
uniref:DELLA protein RGA-like n=1 Tax=Erigeron canadensis TaxID=72917 RepID=UPI001CB9763B|nr:DELLA protein RGA-like [Erigeron canadensis]